MNEDENGMGPNPNSPYRIGIPLAMGIIGNGVGAVIGAHMSTKHKFWGAVGGWIVGGMIMGGIGWIASDVYHDVRHNEGKE